MGNLKLLFFCLGAFEDSDVTHVEGEVDPVRDLDIISEELRLKDEETLLKNLEKIEKLVQRGVDKKLKPEYVSILFYLKIEIKILQKLIIKNFKNIKSSFYIFLISKKIPPKNEKLKVDSKASGHRNLINLLIQLIDKCLNQEIV